MSVLYIKNKETGQFISIPTIKGDPGKDAPQEAVLYTEQTLSSEEKTQARANIDAVSKEQVYQLYEELKALILSDNTVAILDNAILDLALLA